MVKYQCVRCGFFKSIRQVRRHVYVAHGITFYFKGERRFVESEPLNAKHYFTDKNGKVKSVRGHWTEPLDFMLCSCSEQPFYNISQLLYHLEDAHGIHVAYEKGLIRRRVFVIDRVKKEIRL